MFGTIYIGHVSCEWGDGSIMLVAFNQWSDLGLRFGIQENPNHLLAIGRVLNPMGCPCPFFNFEEINDLKITRSPGQVVLAMGSKIQNSGDNQFPLIFGCRPYHVWTHTHTERHNLGYGSTKATSTTHGVQSILLHKASVSRDRSQRSCHPSEDWGGNGSIKQFESWVISHKWGSGWKHRY